MYTNIKYFCLTFLISLNIQASDGLIAPAPQPIPPIAEEYRWLYEALFTEADQTQQPKESFKSFFVHLADSYNYYPRPELINYQNLRSVNRIEGLLGYVNGIVKKRYVFDLIYNDSIVENPTAEIIFNVRVHLKDPVGEDSQNFRTKIAEAQNIWNKARATTDFNYSFHFEIIDERENAHYSVNVQDKTRGPYDINWGRDWSPNTIAHELGHMMGIADEYQTLSGYMDCLPHSLMCSSSKGKLLPHHFYFILRRLITKP